MPPGQHAVLGASGADRWMNCPGSVRLSDGMPDQTSDYAREGSAAHELAERCLRKGLDSGTFIGLELDGFEITDEMAEAVQVYADEIQRIRESGGEGFEEWIEHQFDLDAINPPGPMFGTSDYTAWDPVSGTLYVRDYKHGRGVAVDITGNPQPMYYALGAVVALKRRPRSVDVGIVQPRAAHRDGPVRSAVYSWDELKAFKTALFEAAARTGEPNAPLRAGSWCKFCRAQAVCPEQRKNAVEVAQDEFMAGPPAPLMAPDRLDDEEIARVLAAAPMVEDWFSSIRAYLQERLAAGEEVPGWKLVPKRATRKWTDPEEVEKRLEPLGEDRFTKKLVSPAQAEGAMKRVGVSVDVGDLVVKESSGYNLAPADDPRPALPAPATTEFDIPPAETAPAPEVPTKGARRSTARPRQSKPEKGATP